VAHVPPSTGNLMKIGSVNPANKQTKRANADENTNSLAEETRSSADADKPARRV